MRKLQRITELSEYKLLFLKGKQMKSAGEILKQMAFNPKAPKSTQEALLKAMKNSMQENYKAKVIPVISQKPNKGEQLCFDFSQTEKKQKRA